MGARWRTGSRYFRIEEGEARLRGPRVDTRSARHGNNPASRTDGSGLDWVDDATNFFAGWGDGLTFGVTDMIRTSIGVNDVVDHGSGWYVGGEIVGEIHQEILMDAALGGGGGLVDDAVDVGKKVGCFPGKRSRGVDRLPVWSSASG